MKKEIMCNILRSPAKYPTDKVSDAGFQAAELLEKGGTLSDDGTLTVFTVATEALAPAEVDPALYVPKTTADALFNYLCQLLEIIDHEQWTNPRGIDFRTLAPYNNIKVVVLSNIVNNMRAQHGLLRPVELNDGEQPEQAALRLYGPDSREFFVVCAERYLMQQLEAAGTGNIQHLELVPVEDVPAAIPVDDAQKVLHEDQVGKVDAPREGANDDAPQG